MVRAAIPKIPLNGYRYARQARLVDGADEVHKMVLARHYDTQGSDYWHWGV